MTEPSPSSPGFGELPAWQAMLERNRAFFADMRPGAAVGFVAHAGHGVAPDTDAGRSAIGGAGEMLVWEIGDAGPRARLRRYTGLEHAHVDLLFVADPAAIAAMRAAMPDDTLAAVKRQIRAGGLLFYVLRPKRELLDAGYEGFLDSLGLAFLGACR